MVLAILPWAVAQQSGSSGTGEETTDPNSSTLQTTNPLQSSLSGTESQEELVFIMGKVVLEDGTPPPFGAVIERDCSGSLIKEATVDMAGHYNFKVGDKNRKSRLNPDASLSIEQDPISYSTSIDGMIPTPLVSKLFGCELRAQLAGYQSTSIVLGSEPGNGLIEVDAIVLYPKTRLRERIVSTANLRAPQAAQKALQNAAKAFKNDESKKAEKLIKRAIEIYPNYAEAWLVLGDVYEEMDLDKGARDAYRKAIEIDKLFIGPYIGLARLSAKENKWLDVIELTEQALDLDPIAIPEGHYLNTLANYKLNRLDRAEKSALRGRRMDLENRIPKINLILANVLARKNDPVGAAAAMKAYLKAAPYAPDAAFIRSRIQESEKLAKIKTGNTN